MHFFYNFCNLKKNHLSGRGKHKYHKTQNKTKQKKNSNKMIFRPECDEDISYVYVVNQIFESVSDFFVK